MNLHEKLLKKWDTSERLHRTRCAFDKENNTFFDCWASSQYACLGSKTRVDRI